MSARDANVAAARAKVECARGVGQVAGVSSDRDRPSDRATRLIENDVGEAHGGVDGVISAGGGPHDVVLERAIDALVVDIAIAIAVERRLDGGGSVILRADDEHIDQTENTADKD